MKLLPPPIFKNIVFIVFLFSLIVSLSQSTQNPFWVLSDNPPFLIENAAIPTASSSLPFTIPPAWHNPFDERIHTSANGVFDDCGNPLFYIAGDWGFNHLGISSPFPPPFYLTRKDFWIRYDDPLDPFDNGSANPYKTANYEAPVCQVPDNPDEYFCFYYNSSLAENTIYFRRYNTVTQAISPEFVIPDPSVLISGFQSRFAISKKKSGGKRILYVVTQEKIVAITLPSSGANPLASDVALEFAHEKKLQLCPELELSHNSAYLVWASIDEFISGANLVTYAIINFYDLLTGVHTEFQPVNQGMSFIAGLEFLPDGRLAASIEWHPPFQHLDGVSIFSTPFTTGNPPGSLTVDPASEPFSRSMIELGYGGTNAPLFANNGQELALIETNPVFLASTTPAISQGMTSYNEYNLVDPTVWVSGGLPDQIDGEVYNNVSDCDDNGTGNNNGSGGSGLRTKNPHISPTYEPLKFDFFPVVIQHK